MLGSKPKQPDESKIREGGSRQETEFRMGVGKMVQSSVLE